MEVKIWLGVEEWDLEGEDGQVHGLEEDPSVTYRHGRDLDGCMEALEEASDGGVETPICVQDFHGFQDGGGLTPPIHMATDTITCIRLSIHGIRL